MELLEVPRKLFGSKVEGEDKVKAIFSNFINSIIEAEIHSKGKSISGYILGMKDNDILIRCLDNLEDSKRYEVRFLSDKWIILFRSKIKGEI